MRATGYMLVLSFFSDRQDHSSFPLSRLAYDRVYQKSLNYVTQFNRFTNPDVVREVRT